MGNQKRARHNHVLSKITRKRSKSWIKYKKAVDSYIVLLRREQKEWQTKWIDNAKQKAYDKLKRYWISMDFVKKVADSKGYNDLLS